MHAAILLILTLLLTGCASSDEATPGRQLPTPTTATTRPATPSTPTTSATLGPPTPTSSPTKPVRTVVPDVVGLELPSAYDALHAADLQRLVYGGPSGGCGRPGLVSSQRPDAGSEIRGQGLVYLSVSADPRPCPLTAGRSQVAEAFIAFARGSGDLATRDRVMLLISHRQVATLEGAALEDPARWKGCPALGYYAGKVCPFSATSGLAAGAVAPEISPDPPSHPCLHADALPPARLDAFDSVTVSLPGSCPDYEGIRLYFDDQERIVSVDYETSEP